MTLQESVQTCFRKYFTFSGRASRSEFWQFSLMTCLALFVSQKLQIAHQNPTISQAPIELFVAVAFLPPIATAVCRRLHDSGRSGREALYLMLITLVFLFMYVGLETRIAEVGAVVFTLMALTGLTIWAAWLRIIFLLSCPSQPGQNQYGPNPQEVSA